MKTVIIAGLFAVFIVTITVFMVWFAVNVELEDIRRWLNIRDARRKEKLEQKGRRR